MKLLKLFDDKFEIAICSILMVAMTVLIFVQVIMRRFFGSSLVWSEELARYMFIWLIYIGVSYGSKIEKHIKIEAALGLFPKGMRKYVMILGDILFLGFSIAIVYLGYGIVEKQMILGQTSPALKIPMWFMYSAPVVGFALTALRQCQVLFKKFRMIAKGESFEDVAAAEIDELLEVANDEVAVKVDLVKEDSTDVTDATGRSNDGAEDLDKE